MIDAKWRPWYGLEALYLGDVIVGRVSASRLGKKQSQASWIFNLAGNTAFWKTAPSIEAARAAVERELSAWLKKAGLQ